MTSKLNGLVPMAGPRGMGTAPPQGLVGSSL